MKIFRITLFLLFFGLLQCQVLAQGNALFVGDAKVSVVVLMLGSDTTRIEISNKGNDSIMVIDPDYFYLFITSGGLKSEIQSGFTFDFSFLDFKYMHYEVVPTVIIPPKSIMTISLTDSKLDNIDEAWNQFGVKEVFFRYFTCSDSCQNKIIYQKEFREKSILLNSRIWNIERPSTVDNVKVTVISRVGTLHPKVLYENLKQE